MSRLLSDSDSEGSADADAQFARKLLPEPEPEPELAEPVGERSATLLVEVLSRTGRLVELCVGFRDAAARSSQQPLGREQAALGAFFVEAAYQAGLQQQAPTAAGSPARSPSATEEPPGHGWPLNDAVDDATLIDPAALARIAPRLTDWVRSAAAAGHAAQLDPAGTAAVAPRVAAVYVKRAEQTHRCSLTGTTTFLFQVTSSKWTRACTPGLTYTFESFVTVRAREDIAGLLEQAAQGPPKVQPPPMQPRVPESGSTGGLRLTVSPPRQAAQGGPGATSSAASVAVSAAPPSSPARSSPGRARSTTTQMNAGQHKALQKDFAPQMQHLRVRLRSMSYGSGRYSAQDPAGLFRQFDKDNSGQLDLEEFTTAVRKGGALSRKDVSDVELRKLFRAIDIDRDGSIGIDEFTSFVWGSSSSGATDEQKLTGPVKTTSVAHITAIVPTPIRAIIRASKSLNSPPFLGPIYDTSCPEQVAWGQQNEEKRIAKKQQEEAAKIKAEEEQLRKKKMHKKPISVDRQEKLVKRLYGEEILTNRPRSPPGSTAPKTPRELPGSAARWPECETPELAVASPKPPQRSVSTPAEAAVTVERLYVPAGQERKKLIEQHMLAEEKERDLYRTWLPSDQEEKWVGRLGKWGPKKLEAFEEERKKKLAAKRADLMSKRTLSDREMARLNALSKVTDHKKSQKVDKNPEADAAEVRRRRQARKKAAEKKKQDDRMREQAAEARASAQAKRREEEDKIAEQQATQLEKKKILAMWSGKLALIIDGSDHECAGLFGRVIDVNTRSMKADVRIEGKRSKEPVKVPLSMLASDSSAEYKHKRDEKAAKREAAKMSAEEALLHEKVQEQQRLKVEQDAADREAERDAALLEAERELSTKEASRILREELKRRRVWLGEVPLFQGLATDGEFISELATKLEVRTAGRGSTVIEKGTEGVEMYFLVRGEAEVLAALDEPPFVVLKAGSFFGEGALLEGGARNAHVRAGTSMKLYVLSKENLNSVLDNEAYPDVREVIMRPLNERKKTRMVAENPLTLVRRKWLGDVPLFEGLATDGAFITELAMKLTEQAQEHGDVVVEKGSTGAEMYFLVQGEAEVLTALDDVPFVVLKAGSFFGEGALLDGGLRNAHVRAKGATKLYVLSKENLDAVLQAYPDVEAIIARPLDERRQARIDAEDSETASANRASVLEWDVGEWLADCGMSECEPALRENMIETVEDLLFLAPDGDFERLLVLGLTSTQINALRISLHELLPSEQADHEDTTEDMEPPTEIEAKQEEPEVDPTEEDDTMTMQRDVGEWLFEIDMEKCEPALRENMVETVEDLLFLAPAGDTELLFDLGLTRDQGTALQAALQHLALCDGHSQPHIEEPEQLEQQEEELEPVPDGGGGSQVSAEEKKEQEEQQEEEDMTSMLLQMVEEAHESVQNMKTTKPAEQEETPTQQKENEAQGERARQAERRDAARAARQHGQTQESGGRLRGRRRSEIISADLDKLQGMLAALKDDVSDAQSPREMASPVSRVESVDEESAQDEGDVNADADTDADADGAVDIEALMLDSDGSDDSDDPFADLGAMLDEQAPVYAPEEPAVGNDGNESDPFADLEAMLGFPQKRFRHTRYKDLIAKQRSRLGLHTNGLAMEAMLDNSEDGAQDGGEEKELDQMLSS